MLDVIGHSLKKVYGEPNADTMPEYLRELVARLESAERDAMHASER